MPRNLLPETYWTVDASRSPVPTLMAPSGKKVQLERMHVLLDSMRGKTIVLPVKGTKREYMLAMNRQFPNPIWRISEPRLVADTVFAVPDGTLLGIFVRGSMRRREFKFLVLKRVGG